MNRAKDYIDKMMGGDGGGHGGVNANGMVESKGKFSRGIGNSPSGMLAHSNATTGYLGPWGEDRMTNISICIRGTQVTLAFCLLITVIVLATFQKKWVGAMSGLSGLLLTFTVLTFVFSAFLLALSFPPASIQTTADRVIRLFEQPRLGLVMNAFGLAIWFILSITQTASALSSSACKNPSSDPHAKSAIGNSEDFVKALPSFCSSKKAGSAFCWLIFLSCLATMLLFLRFWRLSRKNGPRIPPFIHPADDGDFQPIADDVDGDYEGEDGYGRGNMPYKAPSDRYGEGGDGRDSTYPAGAHESKYSLPNSAIVDASSGPPRGYTRNDPFADTGYVPRQSYDYGAYAANNTIQDPYAAIQQQLRSDKPPQLPPLYPYRT